MHVEVAKLLGVVVHPLDPASSHPTELLQFSSCHFLHFLHPSDSERDGADDHGKRAGSAQSRKLLAKVCLPPLFPGYHLHHPLHPLWVVEKKKNAENAKNNDDAL